MNCKNCEYAIKCRNLQDNEWYTRCTYEEGECVKITEIEKKNKALRQDWEIMKNTIADYNDFCDKYMKLEKENAALKAQIEKMQETLKSDLIARLKEKMSYSTSPSCTKGMELFIKSIEKWEIKEK